MKTTVSKIAAAMLLGVSLTGSGFTTLKTEVVQPKPLFTCKKGNSTNVTCQVERNKITYLFTTTKSQRPNMYEVEIKAVVNNMSNKVYSSYITFEDKRAGSNKFVAKLLYAKPAANGYSWDFSATDVLQATYDLSTNSMAFEALGNMGSYYDPKHGLSSEDVKRRLTPPRFDEDNMMKAVTAYFIYEYNKAMKIK
jgi:hypothetical protein